MAVPQKHPLPSGVVLVCPHAHLSLSLPRPPRLHSKQAVHCRPCLSVKLCVKAFSMLSFVRCAHVGNFRISVGFRIWTTMQRICKAHPARRTFAHTAASLHWAVMWMPACPFRAVPIRTCHRPCFPVYFDFQPHNHPYPNIFSSRNSAITALLIEVKTRVPSFGAVSIGCQESNKTVEVIYVRSLCSLIPKPRF
jgi:hypothetical protein